ANGDGTTSSVTRGLARSPGAGCLIITDAGCRKPARAGSGFQARTPTSSLARCIGCTAGIWLELARELGEAVPRRGVLAVRPGSGWMGPAVAGRRVEAR